MKHTTKSSRSAGWLAAASVAAMLAMAPVAADAATSPEPDPAAIVTVKQAVTPIRQAVLVDMPAAAMASNGSVSRLAALSDRRIAAGLILVVFAGLSAVTFTMWRELGRRVKVR
jgi:hypothetical protein